SGLIKLVPGVGSAIGGAIAASTAAAITTAFGEAYIATLVALFARNQGEPPSTLEVLEAFREQYSQRLRKKPGKP
ncbi:MAG TPA: GTP-binding protein, partial [Thermoanaerobaculia bacterium]|nr:GTP-binding protein [Thermoanaerobaculia bacterium]